MTARPVLPAAAHVESKDAEVIKQDFEANGPLIVSQDSRDAWRVSMQGKGTDEVVRDVRVKPTGELLVSPQDNVRFEGYFNGAAVTFSILLAPIPAEGFVTASLVFSVAVSPASLQVTMDGVNWTTLPGTLPNNTTGAQQAAIFYTSAFTIATFSLPPCAYVRVISGGTQTLTNCRTYLTLSKTPKADFVAARLSDVQFSDNTLQANSLTFQSVLTGGVDATKRTRVLATDGTVEAKAQGATNQQAGNQPLAQPFYGHVLATTIARVEAYQYKRDQPAALQANTRGELQVDFNELRRAIEQQTLRAEASYMQQLDPNWGFELR